VTADLNAMRRVTRALMRTGHYDTPTTHKFKPQSRRPDVCRRCGGYPTALTHVGYSSPPRPCRDR
jgi:hypothetical protein